MSRRPLVLLGLAAASAAGAAGVWLVAFALPGGLALDARALATFTRAAAAPRFADLADPLPFAIAAAAVVAIALLRRRRLMAAVVPVVLLSANVTTQLLKPGLADERVVDLPGVPAVFPGSWPSGHATASMSLALCLVLVAGARLRPLAALLGAAYAIAVGCSLVALGFHLPSDVLGGYLVAATSVLLGAALLAGLEARGPARDGGEPSSPAPLLPLPARGRVVAGSAVLLVASAALVALRPEVPLDALEHPAAALAAGAIAALGLALTTGLARVLRA